MLAPGSIDKDIWKEHQNNLSNIIPRENDSMVYHQYEAATALIRQYIEFAQCPHVMVHVELFEGRMAIECMSAGFFKMYEDLLPVIGARSGDLRKRSRNQIVRKSKFILDDNDKIGSIKTHIMLEEIELCRRIAVRELGKHLLFYKIDEYSAEVDDDTNINKYILKGLNDTNKLNVMKIIGASVHPLFQNTQRMIASGICTKSQYETGEDELLNRLTRHYELSSVNNAVFSMDNNLKVSNEWSDDDDNNEILVSQEATKAQEELAKFDQWRKSRFLPEMKKVKVLGAYDNVGHLRDKPILCIGPVIKEGENLPSGRNRAQYIDKSGYYNIVQFFLDAEQDFPALSVVVVGQLAPHITTEVDCESLFSQAGHQLQPNRNRTITETFERLVMAKYRMSRMYCCKSKVMKEFIDRTTKKNWRDGDDGDDQEFWENQKNEYLQQNPSHQGLFVEHVNSLRKDIIEIYVIN